MQFRLRDLIWATSLVALGLGYLHATQLWTAHNAHISKPFQSPLRIYMIIGSYVGCELIGAGLLHPFKLWWLGAVLGLIAGFTLLRL
jgi:hypothetical protein